jgi:hypothetical protein
MATASPQPSGADRPPGQQRGASEGEHDRHEHGADAVGQARDRRPRALRLRRRRRRCAPSAVVGAGADRRWMDNAPVVVDAYRPTTRSIPRCLVDRHALAGQQPTRRTAEAPPRCTDAVDRHTPRPGRTMHDVAGDAASATAHVGCSAASPAPRRSANARAPARCRPRTASPRWRNARGPRATCRAARRLTMAAGGLEVEVRRRRGRARGVAGVAGVGAGAGGIGLQQEAAERDRRVAPGRAGAERDERVHVAAAVAQRRPRAAGEATAGPEQHEGGQHRLGDGRAGAAGAGQGAMAHRQHQQRRRSARRRTAPRAAAWRRPRRRRARPGRARPRRAPTPARRARRPAPRSRPCGWRPPRRPGWRCPARGARSTIGRLISARTSPGTAATARSTRRTHAAHVMPSTGTIVGANAVGGGAGGVVSWLTTSGG